MHNRKVKGEDATSKGLYKPVNPGKYLGDKTKIWYMSSWELDVHRFLDTNPNIINWGSEIIQIPYFKRLTNRMHTYHVDYYVKMRQSSGKIVEELWEVKPYAQTKEPKMTKRKKQSTYIHEKTTYETNKDKWLAASRFCEEKGIKFRILTERDIFI